MNLPKLSTLLGFLALAILFFTATPHSFADTYQVHNLGSDQGYFFAGMDDYGHAALSDQRCSTTCYNTFLDGVSLGGYTFTAPTFAPDNGTPCSPSLPAGAWSFYGSCNNGREAWTGMLTPSQVHTGIYLGPTFQTLLTDSGEGRIYMNSLGDIVFDDVFTEDWYEAINLSSVTPEPASLLLLATGMVGFAVLVRRRPALT